MQLWSAFLAANAQKHHCQHACWQAFLKLLQVQLWRLQPGISSLGADVPAIDTSQAAENCTADVLACQHDTHSSPRDVAQVGNSINSGAVLHDIAVLL